MVEPMSELLPVIAGMRVQLRKMHPCGGNEWVVTRTGADIGMLCARCGRRAMLEREEFERRVRHVISMPECASGEVTL